MATQWSQAVTKRSHALDLETGIFTWRDPRKIALSLKHSADSSTRRKGTPYQSAMSMLAFYINRAVKSLPAEQKQILGRAKAVLRQLYQR